MEKIRPLTDRILIRQHKGQEKTPGGLYVPEAAKEKPQEAEVLAVGPGKVSNAGVLIPPGVKPGDRVLFQKYTGASAKELGDDVLVIREDDILGVFEP